MVDQSAPSDANETASSLKRSRIAIYLQLATLFRNRIASGQWRVGCRTPNIDDLAEEFGVARGTIRQAFDKLEAEGLVERHRAKGSFVRHAPARARVHRLEMDWASCCVAHDDATIRTLSSEIVTRLPDSLSCDAPHLPRYHALRRLHIRDGEPYMVGTGFIGEEVFKRLPVDRLDDKALSSLVQDFAGNEIGAAHQTLTVGTADVETAALLKVEVNSPVALMHRCVLSHQKRVMFASDGIYRGDAVRLEIALR